MSTSNGPIGTGEVASLPNANAILKTIDLDGKTISNKLWIDSFNSDLNMEINIAQLQNSLTYRPIRIQERILTFNTIWNVKDRPKYIELLNNIRTHWTANRKQTILTPCQLVYFGANKTWRGFILNGSQSYTVQDVILRYSFNMKLITTQNTDGFATSKGLAPFMPTAETITDFGTEWYTTEQIRTQSFENDREMGIVSRIVAPVDKVNPRQFL